MVSSTVEYLPPVKKEPDSLAYGRIALKHSALNEVTKITFDLAIALDRLSTSTQKADENLDRLRKK
jgi:glutamine synthetase type III